MSQAGPQAMARSVTADGHTWLLEFRTPCSSPEHPQPLMDTPQLGKSPRASPTHRAARTTGLPHLYPKSHEARWPLFPKHHPRGHSSCDKAPAAPAITHLDRNPSRGKTGSPTTRSKQGQPPAPHSLCQPRFLKMSFCQCACLDHLQPFPRKGE